jgi:geranylgeranyl reductase family protein
MIGPLDYDVIVVGAGPSGATVADTVATAGHRVLVVEEHPEVGRPSHCTGKLSIRAVQELGPNPTGLQRAVRGATFYSPSLTSFQVARAEAQAYILDRARFDEWLAAKAVDAGANLETGTRAVGVAVTPSHARVHLTRNDMSRHLRCRVVVGADGAGSAVARWTGLNARQRGAVRLAIQSEITGVTPQDGDFVEIYTGRNVAPGFFAWVVPAAEDTVRVGLAVHPTLGHQLSTFFRGFQRMHTAAGGKLRGGAWGPPTIHLLPTGDPLSRTVSDRVLLVGDAAGQVKSTTGGGLYFGMLCAKIAGETINDALTSASAKLGRASLARYDRRWRTRLGDEIAFSVKTRKFLDSLTDVELDYLFGVIRDDRSLRATLHVDGDIDWQSTAVRSAFRLLARLLITKPKLLAKMVMHLTG